MRVTRLSTTPIKGMALHHPASIEVTRTGAVGDRVLYLVDERDALFSIAKTGALLDVRAWFDVNSRGLRLQQGDAVLAAGTIEPRDPHTADFFGFRQVHGRLCPGPWDAVLSQRAGRPLRLVEADAPGGAHDVEPLTLLGDGSLARLSQQAGGPVDARRFRMLIEFDGVPAHAEDDWSGRIIRIGAVEAIGGGPVQRCAGTTRHPDTGQVDLHTLRLIGDYRGRQDSVFGLGFNFGVYARVVTPGTIAVGDRLEVADGQ